MKVSKKMNLSLSKQTAAVLKEYRKMFPDNKLSSQRAKRLFLNYKAYAKFVHELRCAGLLDTNYNYDIVYPYIIRSDPKQVRMSRRHPVDDIRRTKNDVGDVKKKSSSTNTKANRKTRT